MSEYIVRMPPDMPYEIKAELNAWYVSSEPIVRCKDCARFIPQGTFHFNSGAVNKDTCEVVRGFVVQIDPDGFCAWGEKVVDE